MWSVSLIILKTPSHVVKCGVYGYFAQRGDVISLGGRCVDRLDLTLL